MRSLLAEHVISRTQLSSPNGAKFAIYHFRPGRSAGSASFGRSGSCGGIVAGTAPVIDGQTRPAISEGSLLPQHQVHNPTPANVRPATPAMVEDVFVIAPGVLERVRQNRHRGEVA
jgi:hypothetical protein